jgi:hypothetical protein
MLDSITKERFEEALASGKLKGLAVQMTVEGLSQAAVYNLFESFWESLGAAHRNADEEVLAGCLESIIGWCGPGSKWFEHYLTNEEIDEYRKTNA